MTYVSHKWNSKQVDKDWQEGNFANVGGYKPAAPDGNSAFGALPRTN